MSVDQLPSQALRPALDAPRPIEAVRVIAPSTKADGGQPPKLTAANGSGESAANGSGESAANGSGESAANGSGESAANGSGESAANGSGESIESLLLTVARGQAALIALQSRMAGLVRVNIRRVLQDAARCETVTNETFAELLADAISFDPHRHNAQTWLLTRAHKHAVDGLRADDDNYKENHT